MPVCMLSHVFCKHYLVSESLHSAAWYHHVLRLLKCVDHAKHFHASRMAFCRQSKCWICPDGELQCRGRPTDIYALGACLYTFVFGRIPFNAPSVFKLFQVVQHEPLRFPSQPQVSHELRDLLLRMLAKVCLQPSAFCPPVCLSVCLSVLTCLSVHWHFGLSLFPKTYCHCISKACCCQ